MPLGTLRHHPAWHAGKREEVFLVPRGLNKEEQLEAEGGQRELMAEGPFIFVTVTCRKASPRTRGGLAGHADGSLQEPAGISLA